MMNFNDEDNFDDIRELVKTNPAELKRAIMAHPAWSNRLHRSHRACMRVWALAHNFDAETLKKQREIPTISEANRKRIAEIQADPAFLQHNNPKRKALHKEWLALHTTQEGQ